MKGRSMKHNDLNKKEHYEKLRTEACRCYMEQSKFTSEYAKKQMARKPYATKGDSKHERNE
jgi:hypothetical protein